MAKGVLSKVSIVAYEVSTLGASLILPSVFLIFGGYGQCQYDRASMIGDALAHSRMCWGSVTRNWNPALTLTTPSLLLPSLSLFLG